MSQPREPAAAPVGALWTLRLAAVLLLLNSGLFLRGFFEPMYWLVGLQFDGAAIRAGEWWRILTGNLVHWSPQHFFLDGAAFLVAGLLGERYSRGLYPWLLLVTALAVGVAGLWCLPEGTLMRGLSGVNAGQFAALACVECVRAYRRPRRWLYVVPATALFLTWLIYGAVTGRFFAGALFFSEGGKVAWWAHLTGAATAATFVLLVGLAGRAVGFRLGFVSWQPRHEMDFRKGGTENDCNQSATRGAVPVPPSAPSGPSRGRPRS
jgi:rhomboid family GlyGly-CTERM serine protease